MKKKKLRRELIVENNIYKLFSKALKINKINNSNFDNPMCKIVCVKASKNGKNCWLEHLEQ